MLTCHMHPTKNASKYYMNLMRNAEVLRSKKNKKIGIFFCSEDLAIDQAVL